MKLLTRIAMISSLVAATLVWTGCGSSSSGNTASTPLATGTCAAGQVSSTQYGCITTCSPTNGYGYNNGYNNGYNTGYGGITYGLVNGQCVEVTSTLTSGAYGVSGGCPATYEGYPMISATVNGGISACCVSGMAQILGETCLPMSYFSQYL